MKRTNLLKLIFIILALIVSFGLVIYYLLKDENSVLNKYINDSKIETSIEESTEVINESIKYVETNEERYLKYIKPANEFKHIDVREGVDTIRFVGDIFFSKHVRSGYDKKGIDGVIDKSIKSLIDTSDLCIGNLECCITDREEDKEEKTYNLAMPSSYVSGLKDLNIELFTIANNHILDYGVNAMLNTIEELDKEGLNHIGAGKDLYDAKKIYIKEIDGKRYAILAASAVLPKDSWKAETDKAGVCNAYDIGLVCDEIKFIRPYFDKIIVYIHWGNELEEKSNELQHKFAHHIVDAGADVIVGTHPHIVQEIEYYNGVPIVYSIGNFIFGANVRDMVVAEATFDYSEDEKGVLKIKLYPGKSNYQMTTRYWDKEIIKKIFDDINKNSVNCYVDKEGNVIPSY